MSTTFTEPLFFGRRCWVASEVHVSRGSRHPWQWTVWRSIGRRRPPRAHDDLVERLDAQVRERVRREGVDPQREALVVRRIAEDVVRDHDDLSLTGAVAPIADDGAMVGELVARVSGFGPLQPFLDDPEVEEVWINSPERVFIARRGRHELTNLRLDAAQVNELVERMLKSSGRRLDISTPFVDAMLPEGHRLHVVLEGITRGFTAVNIRKFLLRAAPPLRPRRARQPDPAGRARSSRPRSRAGLNILVAGGTQAGKTTMLNCLAASVPGGERVVSAEEVFELRFSHPDWVAMQTRQAGLEQTGEIVLRDLVKEALRMRPSRILVGEVRAAECLDLLLALNSGLPGMCTLHANSAREALVKMCTLPLLAGDNISARFVVPTVATSVDLVVHLGLGARRRTPGQRDRVRARPGGGRRDRGRADLRAHGGELRRTGGVPARVERYERVGIDVHALLASEPRRVSADGRPGRARRRASGCCSSGRPSPCRARPKVAPRPRPRRSRACSAGPVWATSRPASVLSLCAVLFAVALAVVQAVSQTLPVAFVFAAMAAYVPIAVLRQRAARRLRDFAEVWPEAVDNLASAVRAGLSLPDAVAALGTSRPGGAAARLRPVRPRLPGHRAVRRVPRPAEGPARRPRRGPGDRGAAAGPRGRRRRPRPAAAQPLGLPARRRPHPLRARVAPGLDRQRRAARGRRAVDRAAADVVPDRPRSAATPRPAGCSSWASASRVCVLAYTAMMRIGRLPVEKRILS